MPRTGAKEAGRRPLNIEQVLEQVAKKLNASRSLKKSVIIVRATGAGSADYYLDWSAKGVRFMKGPAIMETTPAIEMIGDARQLQAILTGEKDALKLFLAGGFRVRGDLRYLSDLAVELGILKQPL